MLRCTARALCSPTRSPYSTPIEVQALRPQLFLPEAPRGIKDGVVQPTPAIALCDLSWAVFGSVMCRLATCDDP